MNDMLQILFFINLLKVLYFSETFTKYIWYRFSIGLVWVSFIYVRYIFNMYYMYTSIIIIIVMASTIRHTIKQYAL